MESFTVRAIDSQLVSCEIELCVDEIKRRCSAGYPRQLQAGGRYIGDEAGARG